MDEFERAEISGQTKAVKVIKELFKNCKLNIVQHIENKNGIDIYVTATTKNGTTARYSIEAKDRSMEHKSFGGLWMIEKPKMYKLIDDVSKGYTALYLNTFGDNTYFIWNPMKNKFVDGIINAKKYTVKASAVVEKPSYMFDIKDFTQSGTTL